jgi:hypothetical protein
MSIRRFNVLVCQLRSTVMLRAARVAVPSAHLHRSQLTPSSTSRLFRTLHYGLVRSVRSYSIGPTWQLPNIDPNHPTIQKILNSPEMMSAIVRFMQLLEKKGYMPKNGKQPSLMEMMRWMMDSEVQKAMTEIMEIARRLDIQLDANLINAMSQGSNVPATTGGKLSLLDKARLLLKGGNSGSQS